ncbi:SRPBCC family protein, partial [Sphingobium sp. Ant17]|uniref:SRPBCC family protein n=1 Tax=Sphingobium sp. Ant17 TaxID=1461752 RepID=UPI003FA6B9D1
TIFPNISIFFAPEITQVAQLIPGDTPGNNITNLMFIRREPPMNGRGGRCRDRRHDGLAARCRE